MDQISLLNKVVKVSDVSELSFYYPDFSIRQYLTVLDMGSKVIYTGILNKKAQSILDSCSYIATQGFYQYDLTDRREKIKFIYSKWLREVPQNILESLDYYDDEEFNYCCKVYWVSGRWPYKPEHESSMYELYQASISPVIEFIKKFYDVSKNYSIGVIEQSFFTFMLRSKSVDEQNVSPMYKRLLKSFYNVSGNRFREALSKYMESPIENRELRFLELIFSLRG